MAPEGEDLIFGEDDFPELAPPDDLGASAPGGAPATPAAQSVNGLDINDIQETLRAMRQQVEMLESVVEAHLTPREIPRQAEGVPSAETAAPHMSEADLTPPSWPVQDPAPAPPAHGEGASAPEPFPAFPQPPVPVTPEPPAFPSADPVPFPQPPAPVTPEPPAFPPADAAPFPPVAPPAFPAADGVPFPAADPAPFPPTDAPGGFPPPANDPLPGDTPPFPPADPAASSFPQPDVPPAPAPAPGFPATPSPYGNQPAFGNQPAPAFGEQPAFGNQPAYGNQPAAGRPDMQGSSDQPLHVEDVLVAIAAAGGEEGADDLNRDTMLGHLRISAKERRDNGRTKRNTRKKGATPQFLRLTTQFLPGKPLVMAVTSPKGGVGKSTTAANLAAYIAKAAEISGVADQCKVLLVDGDVANGNLALRVAQTLTPNMLDVINHMDEVRSSNGSLGDWERDIGPFVLAHPKITNLDILAAPDNPDVIKQLMPEDLDELMRMFAQHYQVIIYDTGTQITEWTNCAWLSYASQVYLMVEPEVACLNSTSEYAKRARKLNLITPDVCRVVCIRADMDLGDLNARDVVGELFSFIAPNRQHYVADFHRDAIESGNAGEFLVLDSAEYAAEMTPIVRSALESYERDFGAGA